MNLPQDVYRHGRGWRAVVTHNGDSYMSATYPSIPQAEQAARDLRDNLSRLEVQL